MLRSAGGDTSAAHPIPSRVQLPDSPAPPRHSSSAPSSSEEPPPSSRAGRTDRRCDFLAALPLAPAADPSSPRLRQHRTHYEVDRPYRLGTVDCGSLDGVSRAATWASEIAGASPYLTAWFAVLVLLAVVSIALIAVLAWQGTKPSTQFAQRRDARPIWGRCGGGARAGVPLSKSSRASSMRSPRRAAIRCSRACIEL